MCCHFSPYPFAVIFAPVVLALSTDLGSGLVAACCVAVACALLSVFVVSLRWALVGEGIAHSGFGGAGTIWLLSLAFPALHGPGALSLGVVVFCLMTAMLIGYFTRSRRVNSDAAIGIFMVASLAWGFLARSIYVNQTRREPVGWQELLWGEMGRISPPFAMVAAMVCIAVVVVVLSLNKEILYYCFDPVMAEAAGVRGGFVHYLLMFLLAVTIVIGIRVAGSVLVTALLVLPGATGLLLSSRIKGAVVSALIIGLASAAAGVLLTTQWPVPEGPAIVLVLFVAFVISYIWTKIRGR